MSLLKGGGGDLPSAPIEISLTPLLAMKFRALFTLEILWTLIFPLSGLAKRSPTEKEFKYYITHNILPSGDLK